MPDTHAQRVLTKKLEPEAERCLLVDNGVPCARRRLQRGLCNAHLSYVRVHGVLERYALPPTTATERRHLFEVKEAPEPGICRIVHNGEACAAPGPRRGLCKRHYALIYQRSRVDLSLDDFCAPSKRDFERDVRLRKTLVEGECRAREGRADCREPVRSRGLCGRHYKLHENHPALFVRVAVPDPKARRFELRKRLVEGRCRVLEDGEGCSAEPRTRGLCQHHYSVLGSKPELLEQLALPPIANKKAVYVRADDPSEAPLTCLVIDDDVRCTRAPVHRGLCHPHHRRLGNHADHSLHDFMLPLKAPTLERKSDELLDGLCVLVEEGQPCGDPPLSRGLCRSHYKRLTAAGRLEELALAPRSRQSGAFGKQNDRPHLYLDKNVLFDHADALVFSVSGQWPSLTIVDQVITSVARASISADAIKATYNHVRHRLQRPALEGGRAAERVAADARAQEYVRTTFLRGAWRVVVLSPSEFLDVAKYPDPRLSFEDALEWKSYQVARSQPSGPAMFVTRDHDFPEGVHPSAVVQSFGWS